MQFTGHNLRRVREALDLACDELHNQIATCPDPVEHAEDLAEIEEEQRHMKKLMNRVDRALLKEAQR